MSYRIFLSSRTLPTAFFAKMFLPSLTLLAPLIFVNMAYGFDRSFAWDKNSESDIAGDYIYYKNGSLGPPYNGTGADKGSSPIQIPLASLNDPNNPQFTIHGLSGTGTFYFVATAYDIYGNESGYSTELSYQPFVPTANNDKAMVSENSGVTSIKVISNNNFGSDGPLAEDIRITIGPVHGTASVNNGNTPNNPTDDSIYYTPNPDFIGTDTLTYEICDSDEDCDTALPSITLTPETPVITFVRDGVGGLTEIALLTSGDIIQPVAKTVSVTKIMLIVNHRFNNMRVDSC